MLLDSNIVIYAAQPEHTALRQFIAEHTPAVSVVTYIEVMGYHRLSSEDQLLLLRFFQASEILPLTDAVVEQAIKLRQRQRMSVADAIIAGTALIYARTLVTHNTQDFRWITELSILDPMEGS